MRTIGIKLADGSFYPVLEEFSNSEKQLDLTTAHNNQTKVMVDLYRSKTCSMDDAEYVDSLQIENMVAHPNGEADISFTVSIDENNKLSAKIKDTETGKQSKTTITLVSRTMEERLNTDDYKISDSKDEPKSKKHGFMAMAAQIRQKDEESAHKNEKNPDENDNKNQENVSEENVTQTKKEESNTIIAFTPAADDEINKQKNQNEDIALPDDENNDDVVWVDDTLDENVLEETSVPENEVVQNDLQNFENEQEPEPVVEKLAVEETSIEGASVDELAIDAPVAEESAIEEPVPEDFTVPETLAEEPVGESENKDEENDENVENDGFELPTDFITESPLETESVTEPVATENKSDFDFTETPSDDKNDTLPELNFDFPGDDSKEVLENASRQFNETDENQPVFDDLNENFADEPLNFNNENESFSDEPQKISDTQTDFSDFDIPENDDATTLPDFNIPEDFGETSGEQDLDSISADLPDFDDDEFADISLPEDSDDNKMPDDFFDFDNELEKSTESRSANSVSAGSGNPLSFTGLYDKETELGESAEDENIKKKTKIPVIICVICAVICILATLLVLFIVPSKYNLLGKKAPKDNQNEKVIELEESASLNKNSNEDIEKNGFTDDANSNDNYIEESEPEPVVPPAQEEEVVVVEQAEMVVPEQPPVAEEKPKDINYKIKWGDTLWDLADTYYKNPWRYKYIARFNHIKDPDYIISGTYITIPAE